MSVGCSISNGIDQTQTLRQELTQKQRLQIRQHCVTVQLQIVNHLGGENFNPEGVCPKCGRKLTLLEILEGFNQDPEDFTTLCTGCGNRFRPKLISRGTISRTEIPFFCSIQVQGMIEEKQLLRPATFKKEHPAIYHSIIFHFGTLKRAFAKLGIEYKYDESLGWRDKIESFLGRLPDTEIAKYAGVSAKTVGKFRRSRDIEAFTKRGALEEIE